MGPLLQRLTQFFTTAWVDPHILAQSLWVIIALPIAGAVICGILGRSLGRANTNLLACATIFGSFVLSVLVFQAVNDPRTAMSVNEGFGAVPFALGWDHGRWFSAGTFGVNYGFFVDHLSGTLMLVITGVGFLIHLYSTSYMSHDDGYWRYFAYLNLFVAMMLTLVMADNLVLLFVGWEGVGFCSYLLIGFWYTDEAKAYAGRKAFITNRVGDFAFMIGMMLLVLMMGAAATQSGPANFGSPQRVQSFRAYQSDAGPLNFQALSQFANGIPAHAEQPGVVSMQSPIDSGPLQGKTYGGVLTCVMLLFLVGASGKSAQIPLYVWLPDAMAGPTPVSALIHAATMVTAGVYMFSRLSFLLVFSPVAMAAVAIIGAATALFAALIAFSQDDIKKVLAYSTVSQLGYMFLGVGVGAFWAAVLHLVTHAFFKACLFLGAGSVMHGNHDETNIKKLGGLRREMKWTWATFLIATLAITGIVPLSGFFSKDAILHFAEETHLAGLPWVTPVVVTLGTLGAFCTAFYMMRLYFLTFEGKRSKDAIVPHAHESDWPMVVPLVVLAALSVLAILEGFPFLQRSGGNRTVMEEFLYPVFYNAQRIAEASHTFEAEPWTGWMPWVKTWAIAWAIALVGGGLAAFFYLKYFPSREGQPAPGWARSLRNLSANKFYVDEIYDFLIIRRVRQLSAVFYKVIDALFIDSFLVRGTAWVTARAGSALRYAQTGDVQSYAAVMVIAVLAGVVYALVQVLR
jgi:NADH-quinone oxidoreductase subunit L